MNHRKIRSQGYVPFSWEEKPGIPKFINHNKSKSSSDMALVFEFDNLKIRSEDNEGRSVPPPPAPPRKSKGIRWRDDPFLAALKSCTKEEKNLSKKSFFFSCKHSCNVQDNNLVNFSKLPPIPKERYYTRSLVRNLH